MLQPGDIVKVESVVYRVESVNKSRAHCIPLTPRKRRVGFLDEEGKRQSKTFEASRHDISIAPGSIVEVMSEEDLTAYEQRRNSKIAERNEAMAQTAAIPVARRGRSGGARKKNKARLERVDKRRVAAGKKARSKPKGETRDCACGCKEQTQAYFAPGHDMRFKGWLKRLAEDKAAMDDIPAAGRRVLKKYTWKKEGKGIVPTRNYKGEVYVAPKEKKRGRK